MGRGAMGRGGGARGLWACTTWDRTVRARREVWAVLTVALALLGTGLADATPRDALDVIDPGVADARAALAARRRALGMLYGWDASLTLQPDVRYGTYDAAWEPPGWAGDLFVDATVGYGYDEATALADVAALERARAAVPRLLRRGVYRALSAHARLLQAQSTVEELGEQPALRPAGMAREGAGDAAGGAVSGTAEGGPAAALAGEARRLRLEQARLELDDAAAALAACGLSGPARYLPVRFALPPAEVGATAAYRRLRLEVRQAEAERTRVALYGTLRDLAVRGTYTSGGVAVRTDVGILESRPRAELNVAYPGAFPGDGDAWSLGVHATLVLSSALAGVPELERRVERARAALAAFRRAFPGEAARRRQRAMLAERALALAERQLALTGSREARRALYQAWARYVRLTYAYLDYIGTAWVQRQP